MGSKPTMFMHDVNADDVQQIPEEVDGTSEGIIILHPDGVLYNNQSGGVACLQPVARGVFVPYRIPPKIQDALVDCYSNSLTDAEVAACEPLLPWKVIPTGSYEAWLRVQLTDKVEGILVWENSD